MVEALFPLFELLHHYWINQADRDGALQELGALLAPAVFGAPAAHGLPPEDGGLLSDTGESRRRGACARACAHARADGLQAGGLPSACVAVCSAGLRLPPAVQHLACPQLTPRLLTSPLPPRPQWRC